MIGSQSVCSSVHRKAEQSAVRWYNIAIATYIIFNLHYASEWLVYRTTNFNAGFLAPAVVGSAFSCLCVLPTRAEELYLGISLYWMLAQYGHYVE